MSRFKYKKVAKLCAVFSALCIMAATNTGCGRSSEQRSLSEIHFVESISADEADAPVQSEIETGSETSEEADNTENSEDPDESQEGSAKEENDSTELEARVKGLIEKMTIRQKVAQLFFVTPEGLTGYEKVTQFGDTSKQKYKDIPVGGLFYSGGNLESPEQTVAMLDNAQKFATEESGIPLFIGIDEEGGRVLRIGNREAFGKKKTGAMYGVASSGGEEAVKEAASYIGGYLADYGFNTDFAPVADVLTNKENTVIGDRAFSSDPEVVAAMARAYSEGLHSEGVFSTYKHFPGHGDTLEDLHKDYAYSHKTLDELDECELIPFRDCAKGYADFVMVSHISLPEITGDDTPASLSPKIVTEILRDELHYDGIIITDALAMGAISEHYPAGEAAVLAVEAGCDMLLVTGEVNSSYNAVLNAVLEERIAESRIDESVSRILRKKLSTIVESETEGNSENSSAEADSREKFTFVDVYGNEYESVLRDDIPPISYDKDAFIHNDDGLSYSDSSFTSRAGVDVSYHNGDIDWNKVKNAGYEFAFIRVAYRGYGSEGTLNKDKKFEDNYTGAKRAGLDVGVYIFSQAVNEEEAKEEARFVLDILDGRSLDLPIVYDPESILLEGSAEPNKDARTYGVTGEQFTKNTIVFCSEIENSEAGYKPGIYSNMLWEAFNLDLARLKGIPVWYADYEDKPQTPYDFKYWQYYNKANVDGVPSEVDVNVEMIAR